MKLSAYLQGLRTTHFICVVKVDNEALVVLSIPKKDASYDDAKSLFKEQIKPLKLDHTGPMTLNYYK
jgi:hypothetical protein